MECQKNENTYQFLVRSIHLHHFISFWFCCVFDQSRNDVNIDGLKMHHVFLQVHWQSIETVGDQSAYVSAIVQHLHKSIPVIRDNLYSSRKYFTQFCIKFVNAFIPRLINNIYKCKPLPITAAEQVRTYCVLFSHYINPPAERTPNKSRREPYRIRPAGSVGLVGLS